MRTIKDTATAERGCNIAPGTLAKVFAMTQGRAATAPHIDRNGNVAERPRQEFKQL